MEIKTSAQQSVAVIELSGNLDGNTVNEAQEKIMPIVSANKAVVLDLSSCKYISSAGLRLLLMAAKQLSSQGGIMVLSGMCEEIKDVMEMTGFSNFFKTFDTIKNAVTAVSKGA